MLPFSLLCPVRAESGDHRPDPGRFRHLDCTCSQCKEHACWMHVAVAQNDNHVDHCMLRVIIFVEISRQHGTCSWFIWNRVGKINNWMPYNGFKIYLMSRWTSKLSNYNDKCIYSKSTAAKTSEIYFPRNWTAGKSKAVWFEKGFRADPWTGRTRLRSFWLPDEYGVDPKHVMRSTKLIQNVVVCTKNTSIWEPKTGTCTIMINYGSSQACDSCHSPHSWSLAMILWICSDLVPWPQENHGKSALQEYQSTTIGNWHWTKKQSDTMRTIG